ncbi:MAG: 16S rRNA (cytosine(1402)-N(4))-methyltransferase RsmH [Chloroflexota bacterium]|nr:16S rRNA (cytosine(1402)-N(4))-methyltransferase RsmH [Chloroflexota bacterium]
MALQRAVVSMRAAFYHRPVMVEQVLQALAPGLDRGLAPRSGSVLIDATLGEGGHADAILGSAQGVRLLGLDPDSQAIASATQRLERFGAAFVAANTSYTRMNSVARAHGFYPADGVLFDLGLSSLQLEGEGRGFSFQRTEPLDMRFDPRQELTADSVVNSLHREELARIIQEYGEEPRANAIARAIVERRPIRDTQALAETVERAVGGRRGRIHPATRTFQAIRVYVNDELEALATGLQQAMDTLRPGGRLAVISYHSLEDRLVKGALRQESRDCVCPPRTPVCICGHVATLRLVNRKVIVPTEEEVRSNPRSRSARMRVAERL